MTKNISASRRMKDDEKDYCGKCGGEIKVNEPYHTVVAQKEVWDGKIVTVKECFGIVKYHEKCSFMKFKGEGVYEVDREWEEE